MPYVLQRKTTSQIFTCRLVNHYGLAYYGVKFWDEQGEAKEQLVQFLQSAGINEVDEWDLTELEESEMKICNVRLKNDPDLELFWTATRKPEVKKRNH
ncbi:hypothetical protein ACFQZT_29890 [Paenibacillus sp. GCM10027628]|uniref:hypothetical protein n=1 Tax=Paenibacillus sp. GCM10027628 TaxID=3273413 RepID=UPI003641B870